MKWIVEQIKQVTLFEIVVLAITYCYVYAVLNRYGADQLAVIGGTVGVSLWGRVKGQV